MLSEEKIENEQENNFDKTDLEKLEFDTSQKNEDDSDAVKLKVKRIISIDALRGGAVVGMILVHSLMCIYDYTWISKNPVVISSLPLWLIVIIAIVGYLGMWISFFIFLSSIVNSYNMTIKTTKTKKPWKQLKNQLFAGFTILFVSYLREACIGYYGIFGHIIRNGKVASFSILVNALYVMKPLSAIGWSIIIGSLIHAILLMNDGYKKRYRNLIFYLLLFIIAISITPSIYNWGVKVASTEKINFGYILASFISGTVGGDTDPLLPYLGTVFVGNSIGMFLAQKEPPKRLPLIGSLFAFFLAIVSIIMILFGIAVNFPNTIFRKPPEVPIYLFLLSGQIGLTMLLLRLVEYKGKMVKFGNNWIIKKFRLWSMVSLTLFVLDLYEFVPRAFLTLILIPFKIDLLNDNIFTGITGFYYAISVAVFNVLWFHFTLKLWSRYNFLGSFEWMIIKLQKFFLKKRTTKLNVSFIFSNKEWYGENKTEKKHPANFVVQLD
ncbi:MAG: heparan-alpha-glucosaminide N-acetyltransferase domain-containing protein [Candidatus Heimdallarchaeum endolithica]|uniref:Heparan-alpha-glucosaminide N-acetyltransferase domain-containing protein n=1 Tax=Candidatus Heimdallarchaeum endolithica TaxID=2876572 RepID=A0A9Y1BS30_9ARCH|nr:MAG: heparan-alpha-glucosaminide N-acetyltransferase domain-containing protein [Candidatus Heimdallarchaeum endolithica]